MDKWIKQGERLLNYPGNKYICLQVISHLVSTKMMSEITSCTLHNFYEIRNDKNFFHLKMTYK